MPILDDVADIIMIAAAEFSPKTVCSLIGIELPFLVIFIW